MDEEWAQPGNRFVSCRACAWWNARWKCGKKLNSRFPLFPLALGGFPLSLGRCVNHWGHVNSGSASGFKWALMNSGGSQWLFMFSNDFDWVLMNRIKPSESIETTGRELQPSDIKCNKMELTDIRWMKSNKLVHIISYEFEWAPLGNP